jgi:protein phosphatase
VTNTETSAPGPVIRIPELALVVLIGPSGAGKSSFGRTHFKSTEVLSSDFCRGLVADDENDLSATKDAFDILHYIAARRLANGRLTVIDATNVQREARAPLVALARDYHCLPVAIVLNMPERICQDRNRERPDRNFGPHVVRQHIQQLRRSLGRLQREGFRHVYVLNSPEEVEEAVVVREPLYNNKKEDHGPFDIIGDVHGCADELEELLRDLGYEPAGESRWGVLTYRHREGRRAVFLGDLVDRGPRILDTVRLVAAMVEAGTAYCLPGNHDTKFLRYLRGKNVRLTHGIDRTIAELEALPSEERAGLSRDICQFLDSLISHYVFDGGKLVVAHAGLKEEMQGRGSGGVRQFALYGETTGETDEFGLPVRYEWARDYRGDTMVVYGHTPVAEPEWLNRTIDIDTGCVFGGRLTALRYPEVELVSVPAHDTYYEPSKPFLPEEESASVLTAQQEHDDVLDLDDVLGKHSVHTRLAHTVTIREENAIPALEVMSRFAVDPKWLIYLPPTMSPAETSQRPGLLEHPAEAFAYFRVEGVPTVICEEKHMGSRAVVIVGRDAEAIQRRFGVLDGAAGICYTRTGRRFFEDEVLERELLRRLQAAIERAGLWTDVETDWLCLDCELLPWSVKAQDLIRQQYAAVGAAAEAGLRETVALLEATTRRGVDDAGELARERGRLQLVERFRSAYRQYVWPVTSLSDLKLAPFHLLAGETGVYIDRDHRWHMDTLAALCREDDEILLATPYVVVDVTNSASEGAAVHWWEEMTARGGEGMVVKPLSFVVKGRRGIVQPGIKCRGPEYLRIIYGPEYTTPEYLERLRSRGLGRKRSLAQREFALGIEALERFVRREPLRRVHECVFGVLALESEPVDPRL